MKKFLKIALISVFGVSLVATGAMAGYGEDNKLSGYVKEYKTKLSLSGAKVKLYKKNGTLKDSEKTKKNGKYKFSDLKEGTYKVKVKMEGYRNPMDMKKDTVSKTVKVKGSDKKNLYMQKAI